MYISCSGSNRFSCQIRASSGRTSESRCPGVDGIRPAPGVIQIIRPDKNLPMQSQPRFVSLVVTHISLALLLLDPSDLFGLCTARCHQNLATRVMFIPSLMGVTLQVKRLCQPDFAGPHRFAAENLERLRFRNPARCDRVTEGLVRCGSSTISSCSSSCMEVSGR